MNAVSTAIYGFLQLMAYIGVYSIYMRLQQISAHGSWGRRAGPDSHQLP